MLRRFTGPEGPRVVVAALRNQPVIGDDSNLAETICKSAEIVSFMPGDTIIEESAPDNAICFILAWVVSIRVLDREVAVRTEGQHVGEMALVDPGQPRSASAVAVDEVVIARLSATAFTDLADSSPRLWRNVARELAVRLRQRNRFISHMNPRPVLFMGLFSRGPAHRPCGPVSACVRPDRRQPLDRRHLQSVELSHRISGTAVVQGRLRRAYPGGR